MSGEEYTTLGPPEVLPTSVSSSSLIYQNLLEAAMDADNLVHVQAAGRDMTPAERAVCEKLVAAIGPALTA